MARLRSQDKNAALQFDLSRLRSGIPHIPETLRRRKAEKKAQKKAEEATPTLVRLAQKGEGK